MILNIILAVIGIAAYALGHFGILPANIVDIVLGLIGWPLITSAGVKVVNSQVTSSLKSLSLPDTSASSSVPTVPSSSPSSGTPLRVGRQENP